LVSVNPAVVEDRASTVLKSTDLAIRDLLLQEDDPFALAVYLWTMRRHDLTFVNGDGLTSWGATWVHRILIEQKVGRRRDEEIVSAALAAAALIGTDALRGELSEIRAAMRAVVTAELARSPVPFRRLSYAAALLLAATTIGIDEPAMREAAGSIDSACAEAVPGGRLFGLPFAIGILQDQQLTSELEALQRGIVDALANPRTDYEDQIYLLQALWQLHQPHRATDGLIRQTSDLLNRSPGWLYLMAGLEEVAPAGDLAVPVPVSHLFRAALLDVTLQFRAASRASVERGIDTRYRGRRFVGLGAFGFGLIFLATPWFLLLRWVLPIAGSAKDYWLSSQYEALPAGTALGFLAAVLFGSFLAPLTASAVWALWSSLVVSAVESDRRIAELLIRRSGLILKWWLVFVVLAVFIGLGTGILAPELQHALSSK
jgi:hypothetical protein